jgi:Flp pilus assembly protein TadD
MQRTAAMKTSAMLKLATASLIMGTVLTGYSEPGEATSAASASVAHAERIAAKAAGKARTAIAKKKFDAAIGFAESAVAYSPRRAAYRMLLGQAYLGAGRFASAETAFSDVLTISPDNGRAALNLALVEIARDKKDAALSTLGDYRDKIAGVDYGLAIALAGDPKEAIRVLEMLAREPAVDARVRQNLALAYALDGQWAPARTMASVDLVEAEADARLLQWAAFARPDGASAQVASLLGVSPSANDAGQPTRLALSTASPRIQSAMVSPVVEASAAPEVATAPVADTPPPVFETAAPVPVAASAVAQPVVVAEAVVDAPPPVFETDGPDLSAPAAFVSRVEAPRPVAPLIRAAARPARQLVVPAKPRAAAPAVAMAKPRPLEAGKFVVQLGAYENAAVSRDAWKRLAPRFGLAAYDPANASARVGTASFVRLSVGGFATRDEARRVCTRIAASGGKCFVRSLLGDQVASWVKKGPVTRFAKAPVKPAKLAKPIRVASR